MILILFELEIGIHFEPTRPQINSTRKNNLVESSLGRFYPNINLLSHSRSVSIDRPSQVEATLFYFSFRSFDKDDIQNYSSSNRVKS